MTNAEIRKIIFDKLAKLGYKVYDINNVDGYFIFNMGEDSVTHFRLKGHGIWKHWKFGLWLNMNLDEEGMEDDTPVIQLFSQWDRNIDKFKPSRSALRVEVTKREFLGVMDGVGLDGLPDMFFMYRLRSMLKFMAKHPFLAYEDFCGEFVGYYTGSFFWNFIKCEWRHYWRAISEKALTAVWYPYTKLKCLILQRYKCVDKVELVKFSDVVPGYSTDYIYEVNIEFKDNTDEDTATNLLNIFFKRKHYGCYGYYDKIIEINRVKLGDESFWYCGS